MQLKLWENFVLTWDHNLVWSKFNFLNGELILSMKKAYIHIGTEKTGSTSIQALLNENANFLELRSYHVADIQCFTNHMDFVAYCIDDSPNMQQKALLRLLGIKDLSQHLKWKKRFKQKVDRKLSKISSHSNLLITSEHFHSRIKSVDEIKNLKELLSPYYNDFKIVVYLRRQDKLALSLFNEALKFGGSCDNPLYAGYAPSDPFYDYPNLLEMWASVFGDDSVSARIFEKSEFFQKNLYRDFLNEIELFDVLGIIEPPLANKALSGYKQRLLLLLNKIASMHGSGSICFSEVRKQILSSCKNYPNIPQCQVSDQERERFLRKFEKDNAFLYERWLNGKTFDEKICSNERDVYNESDIQSLGEDYIEELLAQEFIEYINKEKRKTSKFIDREKELYEKIRCIIDMLKFFNEHNAKKIKDELNDLTF